MVSEIERRLLVKAWDRNHVLETAKSSCTITQGYIDAPGKVRVRIWSSRPGVYHAELTKKIGKGLIREEISDSISPRAAQLLIDSTPFVLEKTRHYMPDGWEIDVFRGALNGLVLAEHEYPSEEESKTLQIPGYLHSTLEVTDTITNGKLAEIAYYLSEEGVLENDPTASIARLAEQIKEQQHPIQKIVLTGGPCSGKSTIIKHLRDTMENIHCVPEAATIIMQQIGILPQTTGATTFQRTIFKVQRAFEDGAEKQARKSGKRALLLDRGTIDSVAFTGGWSAFSRFTKTSAEEETDRYSAVLLLEVPPEDIYEANRASNPIRTETWEQSKKVEERLIRAWMTSKRDYEFLVKIPWEQDFSRKVEAVSRKVREVIEWGENRHGAV